MPTMFTVFITLIWCGLFIAISAVLIRSTSFIQKHGIKMITALLMLSVVRLFFPFELPYTIVLLSKSLMPGIQSFMRVELVTVNGFSITRVAAIVTVWACVSATLLGKIAIQIFTQIRRISFIEGIFDARATNMMGKIVLSTKPKQKYRILVTEEVKYPMLVGFFVPTILLPVLLINEDEMECILRHEWSHFLHHDIWIKLLVKLICAVFWWNPFVYILDRDLDYMLEINSDLGVTRDSDYTGKYKYISSILNVIRQSDLSKVKTPVSASGFVSDPAPDKLLKRFSIIISHQQTSQKKYRVCD